MIKGIRTLSVTLLALVALSYGSAQSMEFGVQYDYRGPAAFAYLTTDFSMGNWGATGLWFSPSIEISVGRTFVDGWIQAQFLIDAPIATLSLRGKAELLDQRQRLELRLGVLIGN